MSLPPDLENDGPVYLLLQCFRLLRVNGLRAFPRNKRNALGSLLRNAMTEVRRSKALTAVVHETGLIYSYLAVRSGRLTC